eukprot:s5780_g1.t1
MGGLMVSEEEQLRWATEASLASAFHGYTFVISALAFALFRSPGRGFFSGYSPIVALLVVYDSLFGFAMASTARTGGNLVKVFSASGSVLCSTLLSIGLFDWRPQSAWVASATLAACSLGLYYGDQRALYRALAAGFVALLFSTKLPKWGDLVEATRYADRMEASGEKVGRSEYLHLLKACTLSSVNDRATLPGNRSVLRGSLLVLIVTVRFRFVFRSMHVLEGLKRRHEGRQMVADGLDLSAGFQEQSNKSSSKSPSAKSRPAKKQSKATTAALADLLGAAKKRRTEAEPVPARWSERCGETVKLLQDPRGR